MSVAVGGVGGLVLWNNGEENGDCEEGVGTDCEGGDSDTGW
jgi:hypothetical protein